MTRTLIAATLAGLLGLGLGYLLFGSGRGKGRSAAKNARCAEADDDRDDDSADGTDPMDGAGGGSTRRLSRADLRQRLRGERQRAGQLTRQNLKLRTDLAALTDDVSFARGRPVPWPGRVPPRMERKPLIAAFNRALKQAGLQGEVTDLDCAEYPCVLAGAVKGLHGKAAIMRLLKARALRPYDDDHSETSISSRSRWVDGRQLRQSFFSLALVPGKNPGGDANAPPTRRMVYRMRQLMDAASQ